MMTRRLIIWFVFSSLVLGCTAGQPDRSVRPVRMVRVKVVADPTLRRNDPLWRETARDLLRAASDYYEERFGIRLVRQATEAWRVEGTTTSSVTLMKSLKRSYPRAGGNQPHDVVIGLTQQPLDFYRGGRARADRLGNCTEGLGNYIVSHVGETFAHGDELNHDALALIHEMGHLLGAVHTDDPESVMHLDFDFRTGFDAPNRAIVMKNRLCPFAEADHAAGKREPSVVSHVNVDKSAGLFRRRLRCSSSRGNRHCSSSRLADNEKSCASLSTFTWDTTLARGPDRPRTGSEA